MLAIPCLLIGLNASPTVYKVTRDNINIRLDSTTFSEAIGTLAKNEVIEVIDQKHQWYQIKIPSRISCWIWSQHLESPKKNIGLVKASKLNIRSHPSLEAAILGALNQGQKVNIKSRQEDWVEISCYPHANGWVHSSLLQKIEPEKSLAYFIETNLAKLGSAPKQERKIIQEKIFSKNEGALEIIKKQLPQLDKATTYEVIDLLSQMAKRNPELIVYFFDQINLNFFLETTIYLDVLANVILADKPKIPFYYLAQKGSFCRKSAQDAYIYLKNKYNRLN